MMFTQLNQEIQQKNAQLIAYGAALKEVNDQIEEIRAEQYREHVQREYDIANLTMRIRALEEENANQKAHINTLEEQLRLRHPGLSDRPLLTAHTTFGTAQPRTRRHIKKNKLWISFTREMTWGPCAPPVGCPQRSYSGRCNEVSVNPIVSRSMDSRFRRSGNWTATR
jgi:hypothetical protein